MRGANTHREREREREIGYSYKKMNRLYTTYERTYAEQTAYGAVTG